MDIKWNGTDHDPGAELEYFVASQVRQAVEAPEDAPGVLVVQPGRRAKAVTGFLAFFLGVTLTLGSLGAMAERRVMQRGADLDWSGDWQNSQAFRDEVSNYLMSFLRLGADGTLEGTDTAVLEAWEGDIWVRYYAEALPAGSAPLAEMESSVSDKPADAALQDDKNVLYCVMGGDPPQVRYRNIAENSARQFQNRSFEGYNFYLTFQDGKATIFKDGEEIDVYGNNVYDGSSQWLVPGYNNFPAGDWLDGVTVYMAVREEPVQYWSQDSGGGRYYYGRMYNVAQRVQEARTFYVRQLVLLGLGALWLCVWLAFRKEKRLADVKIASWTGRVWTEVWGLLALIPLGGLFVTRSGEELYWACREIWWGYESLSLGQLAYGLLSFVLSGFPALLALGWVLWLAWNNRRYNPREQRKSLLRSLFRTVRSLLRTLRMKDLERPVEKRLNRDNGLVLALLLLGFTCSLFAAAVALELMMRSYWSVGEWFLLLAGCVVEGALILSIVRTFRHRRLPQDLGRLNRQIESIRTGDLSKPLDLPEDADLRSMAEALNDIQSGMKSALEEQTRSERMKVELISNVSHDLKTPLTSIISYVDLLKKEEGLPLHVQEYVQILEEKSQRLRSMVRDVFEISKAASGELPVALEVLDLAKLLRQTLADMEDPIAEAPITLREDIPDSPAYILADGQRLYRIFQNLLQNALQYSLEGSRVYIALRTENGTALASVRNTSRIELPSGVDFTERFVRGDASRTDGGSGLGLSIARTFTEACGGRFRIETEADLFSAFVEFPLVPLPSSEGCEPLQEATAS